MVRARTSLGLVWRTHVATAAVATAAVATAAVATAAVGLKLTTREVRFRLRLPRVGRNGTEDGEGDETHIFNQADRSRQGDGGGVPSECCRSPGVPSSPGAPLNTY